MKATKTQINNLKKGIDKFNADYNEYVKETGETTLPTIESTLIGYDEYTPYEYKEFKTFLKVSVDGIEYKVANEYDIEEVKESIKYDRKRLNKAWRIWHSENPDAELENDDEE